MRARKLSPAGRIIVWLLSFLMAFSSASTFTLQSVQAATESASVRSEEDLRGMLSVASVVSSDWESDSSLNSLLNRRDTSAAEYSRVNNLLGTWTRSGSLGKTGSGEWLSNVMYEGSILRSGSFAGYQIIYRSGSDSAVIREGLNEIEVTIIPYGDENVDPDNPETDIKTWDQQYGFASRFMLPHLNDESLDLKHGKGYHTRLFIVGIKNGDSSTNRIYSSDMMSYVDYLAYIGAEPSDANMAEYLEYVSTYKNIRNDRQVSARALEQWHEWEKRTSDSDSDRHHDDDDDDDDHHHEDQGGGSEPYVPPTPPTPPTPEPVEEISSRVVMLYMDIDDLQTHAVNDLNEILQASDGEQLTGDTHTKFYILTGGKKVEKGKTDVNLHGYPYTDFYSNTNNKLWLVNDGKLELVSTLSDEYLDMTEPDTLSEFIKRVKIDLGNKVDDNAVYDLIFWGHSGGPGSSFGKDARVHTTENDTDLSFSMADMIVALKDCGLNFDLIGFDSCYMSNTEVALTLAPYANYLFGSESLMPDDGMGYYDWLTKLINNPKMSTEELGKFLVENTVKKYDGSVEGSDKKNESCGFTDLKKLLNDSTGFYEALADLSKEIYSKVATDGVTTDAWYSLLNIRKSYLGTENTIGGEDNGLVDLYSLCHDIYNSSAFESDEYAALRAACNSIMKALRSSVYGLYTRDKDADAEAPGSAPNGLSIYFPAQWRQYSATEPQGIPDQIEFLLKVYNDAVGKYGTGTKEGIAKNAFKEYSKAIACYGLWLKTGEVMGKYWKDTTSPTVESLVKAATETESEGDLYDLATAAKNAGVSEESIGEIIARQINDSIQKNEIQVVVNDQSADKRTLYIGKYGDNDGHVDPRNVDRVEVKISVNVKKDSKTDTDSSSNTSAIGEVSLGYTDDFATDKTPGDATDTATYELDKFDGKWLTITNNQVVSYYDTVLNDDTRSGIIPVAYWTGKQRAEGEDELMTIQDAVDKGYLVLGVFEVTFDKDNDGKVKDSGKITCFRNLSEDSIQGITYDVQKGDRYELLGNYDNPGTNNANLVTLGTVTIDDTVDGSVSFADVKGLDVEYRIVDAYETRYELNEENFPDTAATDTTEKTPDERNLDGFKKTNETTGIEVEASRYVDLKDAPNYSGTADDSRQEETRNTGSTADETPVTGEPLADTGELVETADMTGVNGAIQTEGLNSDTEVITDEALTSSLIPGVPSSEMSVTDGSVIPGVTPVGGTEIGDTTVNPLTGEAITSGDTGMENSDGGSDVSCEYVTPGMSDDQDASYESSDSGSSGGDTGDGSDGGSDDDSSDDDDSDSGSDDGGSSSDSDSSSDSGDSDSDGE